MDCLYYTHSYISDNKTLTKMCIIFDSVSTFGLTPEYYVNELERRLIEKNFKLNEQIQEDLITRIWQKNTMDFFEQNRELVEAKILKPIIWNQHPENYQNGVLEGSNELNKDTFEKFYYWGQATGILPRSKGYLDSFWYTVNRWRSLYAGLHLSILSGLVPISDNEILSKVACQTFEQIEKMTVLQPEDSMASNLAFKTLSLLLPDFPELKPEEILKVQYDLKDEIGYFKKEMLLIAKNTSEEEYANIDHIVKSKILPRVDDIKLKIKSINDDLFRKISSMFLIGSSATTLASYYFNLPVAGQLAVVSLAMLKSA